MTSQTRVITSGRLGLAMGTLALGVALGVPAHAVDLINGHRLVPGSVNGNKIAPSAITGPKVRDDSLTGDDIKESSLKGVLMTSQVEAFGAHPTTTYDNFTASTFQPLASLSFVAPSDGVIYVTGSISAEDDATLAGQGHLFYDIAYDNAPVDGTNLWQELAYDTASATGDSGAVTNVINVTAGTHTVSLDAREVGTGSFIFGRNVSVLFVPTGNGLTPARSSPHATPSRSPDRRAVIDHAGSSGLLDRHISFLEALRGAGLAVSLAEDLDAVAALTAVGLAERELVHAAYAATLLKKESLRPTFEALFDVYFPRLVGDGARGLDPDGDEAGDGADTGRDNAEALEAMREQIAAALADDDQDRLRMLAAEMVARFGAMPGRGPGLSSWSAYTALQRVSPSDLIEQIVAALLGGGMTEEEAARGAARRVGGFTRMVEDDARRRIAEEKGPDHVATVAMRPSIDRLDFTSMRRSDLEELRREIYPLARRLATRLTQQHHANRRGALDFRRTVRASVGTGGVPLVTHHKPKRPHRTELVVLCDVSGSVANFAQFTLLLVFALREQFSKVRAFTFIDHVHEVTHHFTPGADVVDVMADLAASTAHAALWGRTNYGRALTRFADEHADAIGPKSSLLILGDARSNYSDLALDRLADLAGTARHAWWLNPEHRRHWDTGDSVAGRYADVVPMVECRNLTQLSEFVGQLA